MPMALMHYHSSSYFIHFKIEFLYSRRKSYNSLIFKIQKITINKKPLAPPVNFQIYQILQISEIKSTTPKNMNHTYYSTLKIACPGTTQGPTKNLFL